MGMPAVFKQLRPWWLLAAACLGAHAWAVDHDDLGLALLMPPKLQTGGSRLMQSALAHNWGAVPLDDTLLPISPYWSVVSRTSLSSNQTDLLPGSNPYGNGETLHNMWLAPNVVGPDGMVLAGGTAYLSNDLHNNLAGMDRWGAGPSGVMMVQRDQWQWGVQASHIWSYSTPSALFIRTTSASVSAMQPFLAFTQKSGLTWSLGSDSSYDWTARNWAVPVSAGVSKMFSFGQQRAALGLEGKYWMAHPDTTPGWGVRLTASVLFPD